MYFSFDVLNNIVDFIHVIAKLTNREIDQSD